MIQAPFCSTLLGPPLSKVERLVLLPKQEQLDHRPRLPMGPGPFLVLSVKTQCQWVALLSMTKLSVRNPHLYTLNLTHGMFFCLVDVTAVQGNITDHDISGLMGLAFTALAQTGATPFWEALASNGQLVEPEISFYLSRSQSQQEDTAGGMFTLGGTNAQFFTGDIEFLNLSQTPAFWTLPLTGCPQFTSWLFYDTDTETCNLISAHCKWEIGVGYCKWSSCCGY